MSLMIKGVSKSYLLKDKFLRIFQGAMLAIWSSWILPRMCKWMTILRVVSNALTVRQLLSTFLDSSLLVRLIPTTWETRLRELTVI